MNNRFRNWKRPQIKEGKMTKYNWLIQYKKNFKLGRYTDIGAFTYINAKHTVIIGDYVQIGSHCSIYSISSIDNKQGRIWIKKNARIGSHSVIMPGVTIGKNALIGAFSFVNRDIHDNATAYGIPIRVVKRTKKVSLNHHR